MLTSLFMMMTSFPILAFLSIIHFLQQTSSNKHQMNVQYSTGYGILILCHDHDRETIFNILQQDYLILLLLPIPIGTFPSASSEAISDSVW